MKNWFITGIIATLLIMVMIPFYYVRETHTRLSAAAMSGPVATFTGSDKCRECHQPEYDKWKDSHHYHAMEPANETSVLGDFNDAVFECNGVSSRFYRRGEQFFVHTAGVDGVMSEFEILYTFGWYPLQQYLVPFHGGRLQCLPLAWDSRDNRWFHLTSENQPDSRDWLYWTNAGQNWNGMCAECHSTNLKKNYNLETDTYDTTWSEINVSCEACHGPGSLHSAWAELPDMARPQVENYDLVVKTSDLTSRALVELCAPCHARRAALGDYTHAEPDLLDSLLPTLLNEDTYFADGQILEEDYVYGSFTQSKMYHRDVRCSDCHDVHSITLVKDGNDLCLQCHRAEEYDTTAHHFHKQKGEPGEPIRSDDGMILFDVGTGADCVQCHMPGRYYMVVDYRPDHSLRIPRPDLTIELGVPNACNRCHFDKTPQWSEEYMTKWYGPGRRPHYGSTIAEGYNRGPDARSDLLQLADDTLYPVIVRATALSLLSAYPGDNTMAVFERAIIDEEALIRQTAIAQLPLNAPPDKARLLGPLLYDPVKAVRMEAARQLAGEPSQFLNQDQTKLFDSVLTEYIDSMNYSADFSFGRYNLGNLAVSLGQREEAIKHYQAALAIDDLFFPAKSNLALIYNEIGKNSEAETLLREILGAYPELYDTAYSLGLLLAEQQQYDEALVYLTKAADGMPDYARAHYNRGLLLAYQRRDGEAEKALQTARTLEPENIDFIYALADFYLKRGYIQKTRPLAEQLAGQDASRQVGKQMLAIIEEMEGTKN